MIIPQNQWKANSCRQTQYFRERPYAHTSWVERCTCLLVKNRLYEQPRNNYSIPHNIFVIAASFWWSWKKCIKNVIKNVFCRINFCDVGILWKKMRNLFSRFQCFNIFFSTKSTKGDAIYMRIIYIIEKSSL